VGSITHDQLAKRPSDAPRLIAPEFEDRFEWGTTYESSAPQDDRPDVLECRQLSVSLGPTPNVQFGSRAIAREWSPPRDESM